MNATKIRVLIIDDSLLFREILSRGLSTDPQIEVVAKAADPFEARDLILRHRPDVITCDIEMPKMSGIEFIRRLLPQYSAPVIVVSGLSGTVFDAMSAGAVDFVTKPDERSPKSVESVINELIEKVKVASKSKAQAPAAPETSEAGTPGKTPIGVVRGASNRIIGIGASTGGTEAIYRVLKHLPVDMPGIVIVQHIPPVFSAMFAERMNTQTMFTVKEAEDGDAVTPGHVLVAPGNRHMRVRKGAGGFRVELFEGARVNGHCPSVDVLFHSMASVCGKAALGVILTGMGKDGAAGLLAMRQNGAQTVGQDEKSAVVYGMPKAAWDIGAVQEQRSLDAIPDAVVRMLRARETK